MDLPDDDPDKIDMLRDFRAAYDDLASTLQDPPPFEQVAAGWSRNLPDLRPGGKYPREAAHAGNQLGRETSWILVGGQAMNRGFTLEGLTVTYMPRGLGMGNADTVQQARGRFFGYKQSYIGLCRVFVGPDVHRAFPRIR